eukprot:3596457-Amphidinium_carterae.1
MQPCANPLQLRPIGTMLGKVLILGPPVPSCTFSSCGTSIRSAGADKPYLEAKRLSMLVPQSGVRTSS